MPFEIVQNDIAAMRTDAVVNAAHPSLAPGRGVSEAIFAAAGPELLGRACQRIGYCPVGQAVVTKGYHMHAKYIIHAVGPVWQDGHHGEDKLLMRTYLNALDLALQKRCRSVAVPLISSGGFGYPKQESFRIALRVIRAFLEEHDMKIYLVVFDRAAVSGHTSHLDLRTQLELEMTFQPHPKKDRPARRVSREISAKAEEKDSAKKTPPEPPKKPLPEPKPKPVQQEPVWNPPTFGGSLELLTPGLQTPELQAPVEPPPPQPEPPKILEAVPEPPEAPEKLEALEKPEAPEKPEPPKKPETPVKSESPVKEKKPVSRRSNQEIGDFSYLFFSKDWKPELQPNLDDEEPEKTPKPEEAKKKPTPDEALPEKPEPAPESKPHEHVQHAKVPQELPKLPPLDPTPPTPEPVQMPRVFLPEIPSLEDESPEEPPPEPEKGPDETPEESKPETPVSSRAKKEIGDFSYLFFSTDPKPDPQPEEPSRDKPAGKEPSPEPSVEKIDPRPSASKKQPLVPPSPKPPTGQQSPTTPSPASTVTPSVPARPSKSTSQETFAFSEEELSDFSAFLYSLYSRRQQGAEPPTEAAINQILERIKHPLEPDPAPQQQPEERPAVVQSARPGQEAPNARPKPESPKTPPQPRRKPASKPEPEVDLNMEILEELAPTRKKPPVQKKGGSTSGWRQRWREPFPKLVLRLMQERNLTEADVCKGGNLKRSAFADLRRFGYRPSKPVALSFAIGLRLEFDEAVELLHRAKYTFPDDSKLDQIVQYFLQEEIYDIFEINRALFSHDQPLLGSNT